MANLDLNSIEIIREMLYDKPTSKDRIYEIRKELDFKGGARGFALKTFISNYLRNDGKPEEVINKVLSNLYLNPMDEKLAASRLSRILSLIEPVMRQKLIDEREQRATKTQQEMAALEEERKTELLNKILGLWQKGGRRRTKRARRTRRRVRTKGMLYYKQ